MQLGIYDIIGVIVCVGRHTHLTHARQRTHHIKLTIETTHIHHNTQTNGRW